MGDRPIPLHAVRHFEAAARLGSFKSAAGELNVTQGAVSQQIRELESFLETRLFERSARKVTLTEEGRRLSQVATQALTALMRIAREIRGSSGNRTLRVEVGPFFSAHWLAPRLGQFIRQHPEINVHLYHTVLNRLPDTDVDVSVRWGSGEWPRFNAVKLLDVYLQPVCKAGTKSRLLSQLSNPKTLQLLHSQSRDDWREWLEKSGFDGQLAQKGSVLDEPNVAYEAVASGLGYGLAYLPLVESDIVTGRVAAAHAKRIKSQNAYYLLRSSSAQPSRAAEVFCRWMFEESAPYRTG